MSSIYKPREEVRTGQGIEWTIGYYCKNQSEYNAVFQDVHEVAKWTPKYAKIIEARKVNIYDDAEYPCYLDMVASPKDETDTQNNDDFNSKTTYRATLGEFKFEKNHFGIKDCTKDDEDKKILNIAGGASLEGQRKFLDATAANKGSINTNEAPFECGNLSYETLKKCLSGTPFNCQIYTVIFFSKSSVASLMNKAPQKPSGNGWRLDSQQIEEVFDNKGNKWTRVEQSFKKVPFSWMSWKDGLI